MLTITVNQFENHKDQYNKLCLYKTDKNNTQYYHVVCACDRCGGRGIFYVARLNNKLIPATPDSGTCWKCGGTGVMAVDIKVVTNEHAEKLEKQRAQRATKRAELVAQRIKENLLKTREENIHNGYKMIDFSLDTWFDIKLDITQYVYYREVHATGKAVLMHFLKDLNEKDTLACERWIPLAALHRERN